MRKFLILLVILAIAGGAGYWFWNNNDLKSFVGTYVENGEFQTLESRYSPQQMMDIHRKSLLGDNSRQYMDPILKYYPYALMEVKFTHDKKTREGVILWSLIDGEMVLNTESWESTHGFEDAINAKATKEDFKILNALARSSLGIRTQDDLLAELQLDLDVVGPWIDSVVEKHLVTRKGNTLQLHLESPKILVIPITRFNQMIVTKPYNYGQKIPEKYTANQVEKVAKAAFGSDFSIRKITLLYLPIHGLLVKNADDSVTTTYWNAVNGQMIDQKYLR